MDIFDEKKIPWWDHMERIIENVNLCEVLVLQNNHMVFTLYNSCSRKIYGYLSCKQILKCCIENEAFTNEPFAYFILDVYKKRLNREEIRASLKYYHYYNIDPSKLDDLYLILIVGTEINFEIICTEIEILPNLDKYKEFLKKVDWGAIPKNP